MSEGGDLVSFGEHKLRSHHSWVLALLFHLLVSGLVQFFKTDCTHFLISKIRTTTLVL